VVIMCVCDKTTEQCKVYFSRSFYTFQHVKIDKNGKNVRSVYFLDRIQAER
jgi:hypothetical protein